MEEVQFEVGDKVEYSYTKWCVTGINTANGDLYLENEAKNKFITVTKPQQVDIEPAN